jgi:retron-type reverse transcriptase
MKKVSKNSFTYDEILTAYMQCRKHKRNTYDAMEFEKNFAYKLEVLLKQVNDRTYKPGRYKCFPVLIPKPREIWAAPFKDRVVHHLIFNEIGEEFEKHFIDQSYSCLKGRGTLKCINDAFKGCRKITRNFQEEAFYIKMDIKNFFVSINKEILWGIVKEKVDEDSLLGWLIKCNIFHDITENPRIMKRKILALVPEYKSLRNVDYKRQGLPIGNLTSQFFSNIYLNGLDQYCKHTLKLKYYYRYADDILILIKDTSEAKNIINSMNEWLMQNRKLQLNTLKTVVNRIRQGVQFVGARIFYHYMIPSKASLDKLKQAIKSFRKDVFSCKKLSTLNSYIGLCLNFNTRSMRARILNKCQLNLIYDNDAGKIFYL